MTTDLYSNESLAACLSTFKKISKDTNNKIVMVDSDFPVIDFDLVKENYVSSYPFLKEGSLPKSVDGLLKLSDDRYAFIEFKNGNINRPNDKASLREKVYHSIMLLIYLSDLSLDWIRNHFIYILVYNDSANPYEVNKHKTDHSISESLDIDKSRMIFNSYAGKDDALFDMNKLMKFVFEKVFTYTAEEFNYKILSPLEKTNQ